MQTSVEGARHRRPWRFLRWLTPAVVIVAAEAPARAQPPPPPRDYDAPDPDRNALTYLRAAANVSLTNAVIWYYNWISDRETIYRVTGRDIKNNFVGGFELDDDKLDANFVGHPIDGAMYFGAARSTGLGFWQTTPYVLGGAAMFELLSEYQKPSTNDLIVTSLGGIALGEALHRLSSLALDDSTSGLARLKREVVAFVISPTRGANRLATREAWADGAPPVPKHARVTFHGGFDRVSAGTVKEVAPYAANLLLAVDAEYGDLLPTPSKTTIPAYDFFDFYAGGILSTQPTSGLDIASLGLLHGWSTDISDDEGPSRDNNVLGFVQSFEYRNSNSIDFSAVGLGLGDFVVLRSGPRRRLRIGLDCQWTPLAGLSSAVHPDVTPTAPRDYNYSTGASVGLGSRFDMGRVGQLGLRARQYGVTVIDGIRGQETLGHARLWYEVDAVPDRVGVGLATTFSHRFGTYSRGRTDEASQLTLQFYATVRL